MFALLGEKYSSQLNVYPVFLHSKEFVDKTQKALKSLLAGVVVISWWLPPTCGGVEAS